MHVGATLPNDTSPAAFASTRAAFARARREEPLLFWSGVAHLALVPAFVALMPFDPRTVLGLDVWVKPMKFAMSIGIYSLTVALLLLPLERGRARAWIRRTIALPLIGEMLIIGGQAARGVRSHFNKDAPFDYALYIVMGVMILVATVGAVALLVQHVRSRTLPPALAWGIRAGIAISILGSVVGGVMSANDAHSVGGEDGGEGLPVVNWSLEHGDLRVAHFAGLHALQALPLVGLVAARSAAPVVARRVVAGVAVAYALVVVTLFAAALSGRPLIG